MTKNIPPQKNNLDIYHSDEPDSKFLISNRIATKKLTRIMSAAPLELSEFFSEFSPTSFNRSKKLIVGFTGPNGAGKSSLIASLSELLLRQNFRVAVLAFDPASPLSHGALLGDRIRLPSELNKIHQKQFLFRSISCQREGCGVHPRTWLLTESLIKDDFDFVFIESVGVGQTVYDLAYICDLTCGFVAPESGDEIQMMKAGILEMIDLFLVSKGDLPSSNRTENLLRQLIQKESQLNTLQQNANKPQENKNADEVFKQPPSSVNRNFIRTMLSQRVLRVSTLTNYQLAKCCEILNEVRIKKEKSELSTEGQEYFFQKREQAAKHCLRQVLMDETERRLLLAINGESDPQNTELNSKKPALLQANLSSVEWRNQMEQWMKFLWKN